MKILVAIDEELLAKAITNFLGKQTWSADTVFRLVHATEPLRGIDTWPEIRYLDKGIELVQNLLEETADLIQQTSNGNRPDCVLLVGDPAEEILAECKRWKPDLLIIGNYGSRLVTRTCFGGVSRWLMKHADCSVLVVRLPSQVDEMNKELEARKKSLAGLTM